MAATTLHTLQSTLLGLSLSLTEERRLVSRSLETGLKSSDNTSIDIEPLLRSILQDNGQLSEIANSLSLVLSQADSNSHAVTADISILSDYMAIGRTSHQVASKSVLLGVEYDDDEDDDDDDDDDEENSQDYEDTDVRTINCETVAQQHQFLRSNFRWVLSECKPVLKDADYRNISWTFAKLDLAATSQAAASDDDDGVAVTGSSSSSYGLNSEYFCAVPPNRSPQVRSLSYLSNKVKMTSLSPIFELACVEWFLHSEPLFHIAHNPDYSTLSSTASSFSLNHDLEPPLVLIFNYQIPVDTRTYHCVQTYIHPHSTQVTPLVASIFDLNDEYRNSRLKLIPTVTSAPYLLTSLIPNVPTVLGRKLTMQYFSVTDASIGPSGVKYLEVDVHIASSLFATAILGMVKDASKIVCVDLNWTIEGLCDKELPERVISAVHLKKLDFDAAKLFVTSH